jgi:hypothetical protein
MYMKVLYIINTNLNILPVIFEFLLTSMAWRTTMTNRYGNPTTARFYNKGYNSVDRDITSGRFVSKVKPATSWISKVLNIFI